MYPNKRQRDVINVTSHLGCLGKPDGVNFKLKLMPMFIASDRLSLQHDAEFSNHLHTNVRFQNPRTRWSLLEPRGTDQVCQSCQVRNGATIHAHM